MADNRSSRGPAGKRLKTDGPDNRSSSRAASSRNSGSPYARAGRQSVGVNPAHSRSLRPAKRKSGASRVVAVAVVLVLVVGIGAGFVMFVAPRLFGQAEGGSVAAGQQVTITVPEGASGDSIASLLSRNHIIENPSDYYAAVKKLNAESSLKPGDYLFETGQNPIQVVKQLVAGPNVEGGKLTIQEGLTVDQTAARVEEVYGISADEFKAQAKASAYVSDYPFLKDAYNDSLEGFLYPKTYTFDGTPTADQVIRAMLDQFATETSGLELSYSPMGFGAQQVITVASLIERETAVADERPIVASVIYNRLEADMYLQIDAAVVYARGGGSQAVTNSDLQIDSPYNVYKYKGLPAGPICSPSISSIKAALQPSGTKYLYYVASAAGDGSHKFTDDYDEFLTFKREYEASLS